MGEPVSWALCYPAMQIRHKRENHSSSRHLARRAASIMPQYHLVQHKDQTFKTLLEDIDLAVNYGVGDTSWEPLPILYATRSRGRLWEVRAKTPWATGDSRFAGGSQPRRLEKELPLADLCRETRHEPLAAERKIVA